MPELPEVETIVRDLVPLLEGVKIKEFELLWAKSINLSLKKWRERIIGQRITKVWRRGKHLVFDLASGEHIVIHLKMTGQLIYCGGRKIIAGGHPIIGVGKELPNKFTRAIFSLSNGGKLFFNDVRKFGWIKLLNSNELKKKFADLGLEPLVSKLNGKILAEVLKSKARSKIKQALLDQTKLVGLGNIYVDEALHLSKIKPTRRVDDIKTAEWQALAKAIVKVLSLSIKYRGTSFSDYLDASGAKGNFVSKLRVYGRAGKPCLNCGCEIKKFKLAGRGTHWCSSCQR